MPNVRRKTARPRATTRLRAKPTGTRKGAKGAVTRYKAKTFAKAVTTVMVKNLETKRVSVDLAQNQPIFGGGLDNTPPPTGAGFLVQNVMYNMAVLQDVTSNARIGDKISPISCYIRGVVHTNTFDNVTNINFRAHDVHIVVFRYKASRDLLTGTNLKLKWDTDYPGTPGEVAIDGTPINEMLPFSPNYRKIAHRVFRLRPPESHDLGVPANTTRVNTQTSNAPYYRKFAIRVPMPKTLTYVSPTTQFPTNFWFSVGVYVVDANGVPVGQVQQRSRIYMKAQMSYKDA